MCLYVQKDATRRLRRRLARCGSIVAWKVVNPTSPARARPQCFPLRLCYRHGRNVATGAPVIMRRGIRLPDTIFRLPDTIYGGAIHTFLDRDAAMGAAALLDGGRHSGTGDSMVSADRVDAVIPVRCYAKDFIAAGSNNTTSRGACFRAVHIAPTTLKTAYRLRMTSDSARTHRA